MVSNTANRHNVIAVHQTSDEVFKLSANLEMYIGFFLKSSAVRTESFEHSCISTFAVQGNVSVFVFHNHLPLTDASGDVAE